RSAKQEVCQDQSTPQRRSRHTSVASRLTIHPKRPSLQLPIFVPPASGPTPPWVPDKGASASLYSGDSLSPAAFAKAAIRVPLPPMFRSHTADHPGARLIAALPALREFLQ